MSKSSKHALLLVGSPRGFNSTSASLGTYLLDKLQKGGFETEKIHIQASLNSDKTKEKMLNQIGNCDLLILAFPLYADSLPAPLIAALELIAQKRKNVDFKRTQQVIAIVNNGFPEAHQNAVAIQICRQFSLESGLEWAGGLSLGGGGAISGVPLEESGFVGRYARLALDLSAKDLLDGKSISKEAVDLMARPAIPRWLYLWMSNRGWKKQAKACGAEKNLYSKV